MEAEIDRFIAICNPLRYTSILTNTTVVKIGLGVLMRGFIFIVPIIITLSQFPYCKSHVLSHAFCLHQDVIDRRGFPLLPVPPCETGEICPASSG